MSSVKNVKRKYNALVIEDNEYFRRFIVNVISDMFSVVEVDTEDAALAQITKNHFDIVIIDINLHGHESGLTILKEARGRNLYSIMLTDQDDEKTITEAYRIGCQHYLTKCQSENILNFIIKDRISDLEGSFTPAFFQSEYITQHQSLINEISSLKKRLMDNKSLLLLGPTGVGSNN